MAGGQGERFWPMTHPKFPKYRIKLNGKDSLLQKTYRRLLKIYKQDSIYVVTTKPHFSLIRKELPALQAENILIEPFRNNTAPAIFFSCEVMRQKFGDQEVISFFPADHLIRNEALFKKTILSTINLAGQKDVLVTLGIKPTFPATGLGYIESAKPLPGFPGALRVKQFVEKPNLKKAVGYLGKNNFFWNAGIFTWRAEVFAQTINKYSSKFSKNFNLSRLSQCYKKLPNLSIDYALMEKADNIVVYKTGMDWCDIGNWDMFSEKLPRQKNNNVLSGPSHSSESTNIVVLNYTKAPIITLGVKDLIIVKTSRGTLICKKGRAEEAALFFKKITASRFCNTTFKTQSQRRSQ